MKQWCFILSTLLASTFVLTACGTAGQSQPGASAPVTVTGKLGSPSATMTIPGNQLPPPAPKFGGVIKEDALQSKPWWPPRVVPPKGAPNILLIMTDDAGFAINSVFGGVIPTPSMERIAKDGLRYNRIMSTSLCSPTRGEVQRDDDQDRPAVAVARGHQEA
jgi:arylsulfatase